MRPEQFSLTVADVEWITTDGDPRRPTLTLAFDGEPDALADRLIGGNDEPTTAEDADLTVRLQRNAATGDAEAVVGLAHRLTGDFILEVPTDAETMLDFARAARRYGETAEGPKYRIRLLAGGRELVVFEKVTRLVYSPDGELLPRYSLIPGGVEL